MNPRHRGNRDRQSAPIQLGVETLTALQPTLFPAGTYLFQAGDLEDRLYVILAGEIALFEEPGTPQERLASVRGAGELLGELSVVQPDRHHRFSAKVRVDAQCLVLQRHEFDMVLRREPLLAYELLRVASGHLHRTHRRATRALEEKSQELAAAYEALEQAQAQVLAQERLQHELRLARAIQEQMLPAVLPRIGSFDLGARIFPAHEVGGDFYDAFLLDDDMLALVVGDVCGKSLPAALYMAQCRSFIRAAAFQYATPDQVLRQVNVHLRDLNSSDMFVTVAYGILDCSSRMVTIARAGHEYPLLWNANGIEMLGAPGTGQPLGLIADPLFDLQTRRVMPDDSLLLYTDGVTDAQDAQGTFFGQERLYTALLHAGATTADELCERIIRDIAIFQGDAAQVDDVTLLAVHMAR